MEKRSLLIAEIVDYARTQGLTQKVLASRANVPAETLSRAKTRGGSTLAVAEALAEAAGTRLVLAGHRQATAPARDFRGQHRDFRGQHGVALAWSNREAPVDVLIRQALLQPRFQVLLDAAVEFGLDSVAREWNRLRAEGSPEAVKARPVTDRILGHLSDGYREATA